MEERRGEVEGGGDGGIVEWEAAVSRDSGSAMRGSVMVVERLNIWIGWNYIRL